MSRRPIVGGAAAVVALLASWFLAVDWRWYEQDCLDCRGNRSIRQVRLASIVVYQSIEDRPSLVGLVAGDLGVPCPHHHANRWLAERRAGLLVRVHRDPVLHAAHRPWYPLCARDAARRLGKSDPGLPAAFASRVLRGHDWAFWDVLRNRLFDACPPDQRPDSFSPTTAPEPTDDDVARPT